MDVTFDAILIGLIAGGLAIAISLGAVSTHRQNLLLKQKLKAASNDVEHWSQMYRDLDQNYDGLDELCRAAQQRVIALSDENIKLWRTNRTLKGVITKMKKERDGR